ncbi:MAG: nucleoside-diphosphate kinase [Deferribacterales bacterium]|uniref:nucleoside-diphosphate kinase n=1 Tax=Deferrivibrio essentukiensis TaxID=2880922 RepID=UPI0019B84B33|nr:nucleoside-diphosphate kinase [Deferrivibrio essentukiensis]MBC7197150.1 nucleoside-diphosphate kinase [Deferribacterales bacterium]MCB4204061.1 nucleoside-diphosphate kinase [Deferrivibrio essentukiensis]
MEKTFAIIKPDAVAKGYTGKIIDRIESNGFKIVAMKKIHMTKKVAEGFYAVHKEKPFFNDLTTFMSSGPCVVMILEKENAILDWRKLMGATNPANAEEGTLRKEFGANIDNNAVHGSDATETAAQETRYFFADIEMV